MKISYFIPLFLILIGSCKCKNKEIVFSVPSHIQDTLESFAYYSPNEMMYVSTSLFDIYPFGTDSIRLSSDFGYNSLRKFLVYQRTERDKIQLTSEGLKVVVDLKHELSMLRNLIDEIVFLPPINLDNDIRTPIEILKDSLEFEILRKNNKKYRVYYRAFPVYIVNESDQSRYVNIDGNELHMILQAQDENKVWKPITMTSGGECIGEELVEIPSCYYGVAKCLKFHGEFKTKLRVKLAIGSEIIYSDPFPGFIDKRQFIKPKSFKYNTTLKK